MKKIDIIMLTTGLVSLVLSIVTFIVLIFVFAGAVGSEIKSGNIEEGFKTIVSEIQENTEFLDGNGIHINAEGNVVDISSDGINIVSDSGDIVDVGADGVNVVSSEG